MMGGGSDRPATHIQQKLIQVPPLPRAATCHQVVTYMRILQNRHPKKWLRSLTRGGCLRIVNGQLGIRRKWPLKTGLNKSECMDCPPKKVLIVERWQLWRGGHKWKFDCIGL